MPREGPSAASQASLLPPLQSVINEKYEIEVELGRGGMGAVYQARHVELFKPVALKWLLPEFASDAAMRQRFVREARAASNIKHENVVDVYDYGIDSERGVPYIVMELLKGISLSEHLALRGRLDPREALEILIPCMRGVAAAHKLKIVHRDLKPENIFLCESDDPDALRVKVLDFGVAAALDHGADEVSRPIITRTESRHVVGTVFYMPSEQLAGGSVDERADIYALGVILYQLLSGEPPYQGKNLDEVTSAILDGNATPLTERVPGLDPALAKLVRRAMAPRKFDRFANMAEMIRAFQDHARRWRSSSERRPGPGAKSVLVHGWTTLRPQSSGGRAIAASLIVALGAGIAWAAWRVGAPDAKTLPERSADVIHHVMPAQPPAAPPAIGPPSETSASAVSDPPATRAVPNEQTPALSTKPALENPPGRRGPKLKPVARRDRKWAGAPVQAVQPESVAKESEVGARPQRVAEAPAAKPAPADGTSNTAKSQPEIPHKSTPPEGPKRPNYQGAW